MVSSPNPLPDSGIVGKLTREQNEALKAFWRELFQLIDNAPAAPANPSSPAGELTSAPATSDKAPDKPKDDADKEKQRSAEELQNARLAFQQYGSKRFMNTFWNFVAMDHPDSACLKFLRARKWNPSAGVAMFAACMKWRIESGVEEIFRKGEEGLQQGEGFLHQMTTGKAYLHGSDRGGRPVFYVHVRLHKTSEQSAKALEDFILFQMESLRCLAHGSVEKVTMIMDLTNFGLANMDWRCLWFIVKCLESYYPESLNVILIHNPPWVFNGIWKIVSPALDPQVRAKVQLTKSVEELCVHVHPDHLAPSVGGASSWAWKYPTIQDGENAAMADTHTRRRLQEERDGMTSQFETLTRQWAEDSSDSPSFEQQRRETAIKLRIQYFDLDPYIRGRSAYHRLGNIVGNGLVTFRYPGVKGCEDGEYEVLGMPGSKESLEANLRADFNTNEIGKTSDRLAPISDASTPDTANRSGYNGPDSPASPRTVPAGYKSHVQADPELPNGTHTRFTENGFLGSDPVPSLSPNSHLSRQSSHGTAETDTRRSVAPSASSETTKRKSKLRRRLTSTGSRIKSFGSVRSLANSGQ